ncbi:hypothetical protein [Pseudanabaena phage PA-SR01]|nr:hypothetical protein [Pseudanabaena phage PA-SR01]
MTFLILNYISRLQNVEEHSTWLLADCPVCSEHKLKVVTTGKKAGAFACYSGNECHKSKPNPIVKELTKGEFRPRRSSSSRQIKLPPLRDIIKPLPLNLQEIDVTQFFSDLPYEKPWSSKNESGDKVTIYRYLDFQLVRIDPHDKKKFFYFRVKDANNNWVNEVPTKFKNVPVYQSDYISEYVIFVEGEKCASALQSIGLFALSFPSFVYQQSYLAKFLRCLSYKVKNIIYLEDNDETGKQKAQKFLQEAWKSGINASSYNIAELLGKDAEKNYDAADAIDHWEICTREELLGLLKKCCMTLHLD